jgi:hypothetical protein
MEGTWKLAKMELGPNVLARGKCRAEQRKIVGERALLYRITSPTKL